MSPLLDAFSLDGKGAIVTGAPSGLGAAFATGLAEAGADIAICARRVERLEQTREQVEALGRRCIAVAADVANPEDCTKVVAEAVDRLGQGDGPINNPRAGAPPPAPPQTPDDVPPRLH